jgi:Bacterial regulatory helix-turn-helix protein, lysR family
MCGSTACVSATAPKNIVSITTRRWSASIASTAPTDPMPALLTSTSMRPKRSSAAATARSIWSGSVTRAAGRLHIAQQSLSQQIRTLEAQLGVTPITITRTPLVRLPDLAAART